MTAPPASPWTALDLHLDVLMGVVLLAVAWGAAWRARRTPVAGGSALAFASALLVLVLALNGPLHALADGYLFSAHMLQHLLLMQVVAPLLLVAVPSWMVDGLLGAPRLPGLRTLARRVTRPLPALAVYTVVLVFWHLPSPYQAAMRTHAWHVVQHVTLLGAAVLAWWPVLSGSRIAPALPYAAQILYLFVSGMPMTVVGAMVTAADDLLYPFYGEAPRISALGALDDQRLGGLIMWVPAGLIPVAAFTAVFFRWVAAESEDTAGAASASPGRPEAPTDG